MIDIVKYETEEEAQQIIAEKTSQGWTLIQVSNVTEGNFLGFSDVPPPIPPTPVEQEIADLKAKDSEILFTLVMNDLM